MKKFPFSLSLSSPLASPLKMKAKVNLIARNLKLAMALTQFREPPDANE
jgi:hypothetical protein